MHARVSLSRGIAQLKHGYIARIPLVMHERRDEQQHDAFWFEVMRVAAGAVAFERALHMAWVSAAAYLRRACAKLFPLPLRVAIARRYFRRMHLSALILGFLCLFSTRFNRNSDKPKLLSLIKIYPPRQRCRQPLTIL